MKKLKQWVLAMQFLTRIPITKAAMPAEPSDFKGAMCFFTFIGLIVGIFTWILFGVGSLVDPLLGALLATIGGIWITGGIHLDGVSDVFDGFGANRDAARTLEIMKDSRVGTFGVLALLIDFMYHLIGFYLLREDPYLMIWVPVSAKMAVCLICSIGRNVSKGMGSLWIQNISKIGLGFNLLVFCGVGISLVSGMEMILGLLIVGVTVFILNHKFSKKLNGLNGDCLGATHQLAEWVILTYLMIISKGMIG
ncbi:adenosylcobinamide-GDP ribazoletransferase [Niameybacter massiliensis]|uniref:Adenosylcobinamide-GDP ribazoletransferase n=1 Tax=Holtiella tumoricola TaxID=3018743 RepID=A0AA42IZX9_9FIRM|nr:adenosylcobinamide-GDP ribazoletransferase [Holtiella tumoricola]MDA3730621.1 adenosylcobinamide-GDP ribazoletransferase [Holtiella tumoricola]